MRRALALTLVAWLAPLGVQSVAAQTAGPMTVERIHSGFLAAPEVKITEVDHKTSELVGGFAGWNYDSTFFVGAGGYWLAHHNHNDREMGYGGLVVQWLANGHGAAGFGAKALVGGGEATLTESITIRLPPPILTPIGRIPTPVSAPTRIESVRVRQGFAIAEPELLGFVRLNSHVKLTGAAGYRFTGTDRRGFDSGRLNGATGSVGLQISGG